MRPWRALPLALLLGATLAAAQDAAPEAAPAAEAATTDLPVGVEVTLGFGNKVPQDGFLSLAVDLTNRGATTSNAQVTIRAQEGGNVLLRLGPVELEAAARRRLVGVVPARPTLEAGALLVSVEEAADGAPLGHAAVHPEGAPARLLVALDRRGGAPADLSTLRTPEPGGESRWTAVIATRLEDLPQSPLGYSGLGAVLLGDLELEGWPDPEARALAAWVARGGHLIAAVGPRARLLRGRSLVGKHLGTGLRPLPDAPPERDVPLDGLLKRLRGTFGLDAGEAPPPAPALAALLPGPEDLVLLRAGDRPFAVRRRHGLGQVTLVAADLWAPPFLHSPVTARLLEALLTDGPAHAPRSRLLFKELAGVRQPARVGPAFAVLIFYALIVGPGVYFVLRARKRGILLWVVIPAGTVLCTALVPLYRIVLRDAESTLVAARLIEGWSGQPFAVETTDALLFSGSLEPKRFEYQGADAVAFSVVPPRRRGAPDLGAALAAGPEGLALSLPVALWGTRYLSFEAGGPAPGAEGAVHLRFPDLAEDPSAEPSARLRLRWDGPTLREAFVVYPAGPGPLGHVFSRDLSPGTVIDEVGRSVSPQSLGARDGDLGGLVLGHLLSAHFLPTVGRERVAYLMGLVDAPPPLRALPNVRTRAFTTVVAVELPVVFENAVPFGVARPVREGSTVGTVGAGSVEREVRTRLLLPGGAGRQAARVRVRATAHRVRSVMRLRVDAFDRGANDWVAILPREEGEEDRDGLARRTELELEAPAARFVSDDGAVLLRQRFVRPRQDGDEAHLAQLDVSVEWDESE
ncbi:MAG: hypothetical protein M9894_24980 [Planctomycetes bacterium]|nr:hypothetical protein [Planctomycetota bacterium]